MGGSSTSTVGGNPNSELGQNFIAELNKILGGAGQGIFGSAIGNIGDPAGVTSRILEGVGDVGFDLNSDFGKAFTANQDRTKAEDFANLNSRLSLGGLGFGSGASRLGGDFLNDRSLQNDLALGELDQRARGTDLQSLLGLSGQQFGFGSNILQQLGIQTGLATPRAQNIQSGGFGDFLGGLTGLVQGLAPFAGPLGAGAAGLAGLFGGGGGSVNALSPHGTFR